jgi:hypothetical protein
MESKLLPHERLFQDIIVSAKKRPKPLVDNALQDDGCGRFLSIWKLLQELMLIYLHLHMTPLPDHCCAGPTGKHEIAAFSSTNFTNHQMDKVTSGWGDTVVGEMTGTQPIAAADCVGSTM